MMLDWIASLVLEVGTLDGFSIVLVIPFKRAVLPVASQVTNASVIFKDCRIASMGFIICSTVSRVVTCFNAANHKQITMMIAGRIVLFKMRQNRSMRGASTDGNNTTESCLCDKSNTLCSSGHSNDRHCELSSCCQEQADDTGFKECIGNFTTSQPSSAPSSIIPEMKDSPSTVSVHLANRYPQVCITVTTSCLTLYLHHSCYLPYVREIKSWRIVQWVRPTVRIQIYLSQRKHAKLW